MDDVAWFFIAVMLSVAGWLVGRRAGAASDRASRLAALLGLVALLTWVWLVRNPSVSVQLIPLWVLSRLEGVGSVPLFAIVLGVCWERAHLPRQRFAIGWAMALGIVYLVNGGSWLLKQTPDAAFADKLPVGSSNIVFQSQDYSCVPAACATLLHRWGHPTSEAEMVALTRTRSGSGSTTLRALEGLSARLVGTDLRPVLLQVEIEDLASLPMPLLTPLRLEASREHMVGVFRVDFDAFLIFDPMEGSYRMRPEEFERYFTGRVIVLEKRH